ncbi:hypothetical protein E4M02_10950 [Brevundimonas sp. S30B]|uniref:thermonuclease family protein n=1 Tax=unclassified Brevundimonas TaxID=2622653 RepID=UPI001071F6CF|nr:MULTISPECIES: thermonuclease family protein [unclassified Brevundimonas]QBX38631.1 hypothetical protein E4M01_13210 [Brevundimonas sp. MF30-B]TFW01222.1 hypothetical protein E4M02_10950 [Brevundimonas sp. S30B]
MIEILICATLAFSDGDSGRCRTADGENHRVRLAGVDAGEVAPHTRCRQQPAIWACSTTGRAYAAPATQRARQLAQGGARCRVEDRDRYGRIVAVCTASGRDIGGTLITEGLAIADPRYGARYRRLEAEARRQGRGLWRDTR